MEQRQIHVLHFIHSMNMGGAENMIMNLYRSIDREVIQFDFLVHSNEKGIFEDEIEKLGGKIYRAPYYKIINGRAYTHFLDNFFRQHSEIKIVHGHVGSCAHIYLKIAKKYGCFTIAHSHNARPKISVRSIAYRFFTYRTRHVADYFMSCGQKAGEYRFGKKITKDIRRYHILNNGIDTNKFVYNVQVRNRIRKELGIGDSELLIGHIGRFQEQKNHKYLIGILKELVKYRNDVKLIMVGDGELRQKIENQVKADKLSEHVIFAGIRNDVNDLLQGMDCFVFPSFYEGLPVTVIEAQASGLPCIISENVTKEVNITDLVTYLPIAKYNLPDWAAKIIKESRIQRRNTKEEIVNAGYDVEETANWLQRFYVSKA